MHITHSSYVEVLMIFILKLFIFWNPYVRMSNSDVMNERRRENNHLSWIINEKVLTTVKCLVNVCEICQ